MASFRIVWVVLVAGLWYSPVSFAETNKKPTLIPRSKEEAAPPVTAPAATSPEIQLSIMPSVGFLEGTFGFGGGIDLMFRVETHFYIGLDTGYYRWSESASGSTVSGSTTITSIPFLPTAIYKFEIPNSSFRPYAGVAVGLSLVSSSVTISGSPYSNSKFDFEFLGRPGLEIVFSPEISLTIEPKVGILDNSFVFLPQAGIAITLL